MKFAELIPLIVSTLGGGILGGLLTFKISLKKQGLSEFEALIKEYKVLNNEFKERLEIVEKELVKVRNLETTQRLRISTLESELTKYKKDEKQ
tara:strand:+ start:49 stop:327 length:279 start_codon:yes stop_codon:yes gene_type:complete